MERALKERIIGAAVLVALAVVVVPVFLDGPPTGGEVLSERVPLPGQNEQVSQTIVLERNRSEPVPAQAAPAPVEQSPAPAAVDASRPASKSADSEPEETEPEQEQAARQAPPGTGTPPKGDRPAPPAAEAPGGTSATGMYAVQLGSFSSKENAEKLAAELRRQGFAAFLSQLDTGSAQLHRVRIGPQKDRQAAEAMAARLAKAGHEGQVLPHP